MAVAEPDGDLFGDLDVIESPLRKQKFCELDSSGPSTVSGSRVSTPRVVTPTAKGRHPQVGPKVGPKPGERCKKSCRVCAHLLAIELFPLNTAWCKACEAIIKRLKRMAGPQGIAFPGPL